MAEKNMRLRVVLDLAERVLGPLKRIQSGSNAAAQALKETRDRLKELNAQQAAVGNVQRQQAEYARLNNELKIKQAMLASMRASGTATAAQIKREEGAVARLTAAFEQQRAAAVKARAGLNAMGIAGNLGAAQARLKADIDGATGAMARQRAEMQRLAEQQKRVAALNDKHRKAMLHTGMAAAAGVGMVAAGRRGVQVGMGPVGDYASHQTHMLGIAKQVEGARDPKTGKLGPAYYELEAQIRAMSTQVPMLTNDITDMFTAGARMEVPKQELQAFVRLASDMASAFEAPPAELAESMGKIGKNFKIPVADMRGMADAINYLDDNAISKGADIIDMLNRIGGIAGSVKISGADMAALGSTLLTLGDTSETASTGIKTIFTRMAAATKMSKKFQGAVREIGLKPEDIQAGMAQDAVGTLLKLSEAIKKLPEKDRMGVMAEIAGVEHVGRLAKLVGNTEELRRQIALANGEDAKGSMAREAAARNETLAARWQMLKNGAFNLSAVVGETLQPALMSLMEAVTPLIERFAKWVKENPALVGGVMKLVVGASALLAVLGAVLVPLAIIAGKAMLVRFLFARLALAMGGQLKGALHLVGAAALNVGRALMFTPIGAIVAGIAVAALLIYKYWQPLSAFFTGLWEGFRDALAPAFAAIGGALEPLKPAFDWLMGALGGAWKWFTDLLAPMQATQGQLQGISNMGQFLGQVLGTLVNGFLSIPSAFYELGKNVVMGFVNGLVATGGMLKDSVLSMASSVAGWFREKLGINSPSRVFMEYGGWISEGAAAGINGGAAAVRAAALGIAAAASMPMGAAAGGAMATAGGPAMAATQRAQAAPAGGGGYQITINAAPGMDAQAIARAVAAEIDKRERAAGARRRSGLRDLD